MSVWITSGFFLDAWAHFNVPIETFFTPYHAMFYSGIFAMIALLAAYWLRHRGLPPGYRFAMLGIPVFLLAGIGDLTWHTLLGIEQGVDAVMSPTHQALGVGIAILSSGPIGSVLADRANSKTLRTQLPFVLSLAAWLTLAHFATSYVFDPGAGRTGIPIVQGTLAPVYDKIAIGALVTIFQSVLMSAFALWMVGRIRLAPGSFTIFYVLGNISIAWAFTNQSPLLATTLVQSLVAGIVADALVARYDPSPERPGAYRIFAIGVPLAYAGAYLLSTALRDGLWWDANEAFGVWMSCGIAGFALSLIGTARFTPS
ncbi:MAG TPA: hypothetical protein VNF68_13350 [Candidatus Baltobacteraceae bacterium]|nr:hypothetical protein [Candidatus Baltobacteraceae bacterium]